MAQQDQPDTGGSDRGSELQLCGHVRDRLHIPRVIVGIQCVHRNWTDLAACHLCYSSSFVAVSRTIVGMAATNAIFQTPVSAGLDSERCDCWFCDFCPGVLLLSSRHAGGREQHELRKRSHWSDGAVRSFELVLPCAKALPRAKT